MGGKKKKDRPKYAYKKHYSGNLWPFVRSKNLDHERGSGHQ
jgi:hypothetical protein